MSVINLNDNLKINSCGNCKHWKPHTEQKYDCKMGDCMKINDGTEFSCEIDTYFFTSDCIFEDDYYDDTFKCFEEK